MDEKMDIKAFAEKFEGVIIIDIFKCTSQKVMEICKKLEEIHGEYWAGGGSSGVRFKKDGIKVNCYFFNKEEEYLKEKEV